MSTRLALRYHPDKVLSNNNNNAADGSKAAEEASQKFQQLGFAYAVLSEPSRRSRYDNMGRTDESLFAGMGEDGNFNWDEYFKEIWTGQVSGKSLGEFKKKYQGSKEELDDIYAAYEEAKGSLEGILALVPCSEVLADEERFVQLVEAAIKKGDLKRLPGWTAEVKDTKKRKAMREKAKKEASEAEEHARELGVWDDLFGKGAKKGTKSSSRRAKVDDDEEDEEVEGDGQAHEQDADDDEEEVKKPKKKGKAAAIKAAGSKGKMKKEEEGEDISGLAALIRNRQTSRANGLDNLINRMEADAKSSSKKGSGKKDKGGPPPSDAEFEALQAKMFGAKEGGKGAKQEEGKKRKADGPAAASGSKGTKAKK